MPDPKYRFDTDNYYEVNSKLKHVKYSVGNYREGGSYTVSFCSFLDHIPTPWVLMSQFSGVSREKVFQHYKTVCEYILENTKVKQASQDQFLDDGAQAWLSLTQEHIYDSERARASAPA